MPSSSIRAASHLRLARGRWPSSHGAARPTPVRPARRPRPPIILCVNPCELPRRRAFRHHTLPSGRPRARARMRALGRLLCLLPRGRAPNAPCENAPDHELHELCGREDGEMDGGLGHDRHLNRPSPRIIELAHLHRPRVEPLEQPRVHPHLPEILAQRLPVRPAAAGRAVMDADHPIAPDIGDGLPLHVHLGVGIIGDQPRQLAAQRAVARAHPIGRARDRDRHRAAMAAPFHAHLLLHAPTISKDAASGKPLAIAPAGLAAGWRTPISHASHRELQ